MNVLELMIVADKNIGVEGSCWKVLLLMTVDTADSEVAVAEDC